MPLKPRYHYAWFEAQTPDADGCISLGKYGLKVQKVQGAWKAGRYNQKWDDKKGKYTNTKEFQAYGPEFHKNKILCTGYPWSWSATLGIKRHSRASKLVKSPVYEWGPIEVQGEGPLTVEHTPDGFITSVHTESPALQKTWHKEKYAQEKEKRRKAEKTLKVMMKMGVMGEGEVPTTWGPYVDESDIANINYAKVLDSLADADGETDNKDLEKISALLRKVRQTYRCTPEEAFENIRGRLRDHVYQQKNVYTWEPVQDGRDRVDL